jgi:hypothetical protein
MILITGLIIAGTLYWCSKVKSGELTCGMNLWDITRSEFDKLINKRKFSALNSWVNTPFLSYFYSGKFNELDTCIFSIGKDRYNPPTFGVLITSIRLPFPNFIVRPKSFTQEVGDMLGMREHFAAIPALLIDKYEVKSEDEGMFASKLTPEIISMFLNNEDVTVEYLNGALLVTPTLISEEKNYESAVQLAHAFARSFGVDIDKKKASDS